jgi:hypothetical protein
LIAALIKNMMTNYLFTLKACDDKKWGENNELLFISLPRQQEEKALLT